MRAFRLLAHHLPFRRAIPSPHHQHHHLLTVRPFASTHALLRPSPPPSSPLLRLLSRHSLRLPLRRAPHRGLHTAPPPPPSLSLTARLRKLSREYGWSALGVYALLSALDFPFSFIAVRMLGTERIGQWEAVVVEWFWRGVGAVLPGVVEGREEKRKGEGDAVVSGQGAGAAVVGGGAVGIDHGVLEAEERNLREDASIWTQLALAYAIHKSFIFIRVPLTAAVTPKVVRVLRGWGWDIGKRKAKGVAGGVDKAVKKD